MIRILAVLGIVAAASCGFGRWVLVSARQDPLESMLSPYLTPYCIAPILCLLAAVDGLSAARATVLVRSHSVRRWSAHRLLAGTQCAVLVSVAAVVGALLARIGLPVPSVGHVLRNAVVLGIDVIGLAVIVFGIAGLAALAGRTAVVVSMLGGWVSILIAARRGSALAVWGNPAQLARTPIAAAHLVWPTLLVLATAALLDLSRQGRLQVLLRPGLVYLVVAGACTIAQAFAGRPVLRVDGTVGRLIEPFAAVLGGLTGGPGIRQFLFVSIIHVGYAAAFAVHLANHQDGPWPSELIRLGSVRRWTARMSWPWICAAPVVPLAGLAAATAAAVAYGLPLPGVPGSSLTATRVTELVAAATGQLIVYLLVVVLVRRINPAPSTTLILAIALVAASFARLVGVPIPGVAMNDVLAIGSTGFLTTAITLAVTAAVLVVAAAAVGRLVPSDRRITS